MRLALMTCILATAPVAWGQFDPNSPTTQWTPIIYASGFGDASGDEKSGGANADIVGDASNPSFFMNYTSGWLGVRLRVGAASNQGTFKSDAFVGLDVNGDGRLDLYIGVDNQSNPGQLGIWYPGGGLNSTPNNSGLGANYTTYTENSSIYGFTAVSAVTDPNATSFDLNGDGKTDQFLSFEIPFADVQAALAAIGITGVTANTPMTAVAGTASGPTSLNQDINGANGGTTSLQTWSQVGALSQSTTANSLSPVPEPSQGMLFCFAVVVGAFYYTANKGRA
jgi:hypothetical protein